MNVNIRILVLLIFVYPSASNAQLLDTINSIIEKEGYNIYYSYGDPAVNQIRKYVASGLKQCTRSLNREFTGQVDVYLFPSRKMLDQQWQSAWNMPSFVSECWMVGSGVQSRLDLLSPSVWDSFACEHDPKNESEIKRLVHHELVHILHSDYNLSPSFEDINNIDWFVEGLATFISGQLDSERLIRTIKYVRETDGPNELSMLWKGNNRYGLAGSMIAYIDAKYGREMLSELMRYNDVNDILDKLEVTEEDLISRWKEALLNAK